MTKMNEGIIKACDMKQTKNDIVRDLVKAYNDGYRQGKIDAGNALKAKYNDLRNELCIKCGKYKEAHNGACDGCRWEVTDNEIHNLPPANHQKEQPTNHPH